MKQILVSVLFFIFGAVTTTHAGDALDTLPSGTYDLDLSHSSLVWKVNHSGLSNYTARFTKMSGALDLDTQDPTKSTLTVEVDPMSLETHFPFDYKDWNKELKEDAKLFNATAHPSISFKSTGIEMTGENTGVVTGDLTFLGVTKPIALDVTFNGAFLEMPFVGKPVVGFTASATVERSKWGMEYLSPSIGDNVSLLIEAEFMKHK